MCAWVRMTQEAAAVRDGAFKILAELPDGFAGNHGDGQRDVDAARARLHRDRQPRIRRLMNRIRHASGLAAEQQDVAPGKGKTSVGTRGFGGEQHQPAGFALAPILEGVPVDMPGQGSHFEVVHSGSLEGFVGEREAGRFDNIDAKAEAGGEAQDCPGVAGDIRLVEGDAETVVHFRVFLISGRSATADSWFWKLLDLRVAIFCEVDYTARIVNPNRWRGNS
jgi:hypothetical protein